MTLSRVWTVVSGHHGRIPAPLSLSFTVTRKEREHRPGHGRRDSQNLDSLPTPFARRTGARRRRKGTLLNIPVHTPSLTFDPRSRSSRPLTTNGASSVETDSARLKSARCLHMCLPKVRSFPQSRTTDQADFGSDVVKTGDKMPRPMRSTSLGVQIEMSSTPGAHWSSREEVISWSNF